MNSRKRALVPVAHIVPSIYTIRGELVLLDPDLAALYGATAKHFVEQVQRNLRRFPREFVFQLSAEETAALKSQFVPVNFRDDGLPYAFTEHGAIVAAMILNSAEAVETSAHVAGAFTQLREQVREAVISSRDLALSVARLARHTKAHDAMVGILEMVFDLIKAPNALLLTQAERAELKRRLDEYAKNK